MYELAFKPTTYETEGCWFEPSELHSVMTRVYGNHSVAKNRCGREVH